MNIPFRTSPQGCQGRESDLIRDEDRPNRDSIPDLLDKLESVPAEDRWRVQYDLVWAYFDADDYEKAIETFEASRDSVPDDLLSELVMKASEAHEQFGELERAKTILQERIDELEELGKGKSAEMGKVLLRLGKVHSRQSDFDEAMEKCQMSLAIFTESQISVVDQVSVLSTMGLIMWEKGDYELALKLLHEGREIAEKEELGEGLKWIYNSLGLVNYQLGNYEKALEFYKGSMNRERDKKGSMMALLENNIALVHIDRGEYGKAEEHLERSLELNEDIENFVGCSLNFLNLGLMAVERGEVDRGRDLLNKSASLCRQMKEKWIHALCNIGLARAYLVKGELKMARHNAEKALELSGEMKAKESRGMALRELGRVEELEGERGEALEHLEESVSIFRDMENPYDLAKSLHFLGRFLIEDEGEKERGVRILEDARETAQRIGAKGVLGLIVETVEKI